MNRIFALPATICHQPLHGVRNAPIEEVRLESLQSAGRRLQAEDSRSFSPARSCAELLRGASPSGDGKHHLSRYSQVYSTMTMGAAWSPHAGAVAERETPMKSRSPSMPRPLHLSAQTIGSGAGAHFEKRIHDDRSAEKQDFGTVLHIRKVVIRARDKDAVSADQQVASLVPALACGRP